MSEKDIEGTEGALDSDRSPGKKKKKSAIAAWAARITAMLLGRKAGEQAAEEMKARDSR